MFLIPSKLKQHISPKDPINLFLYFVPKACAASSITRKSYSLAKEYKPSKSPAPPP